MKAAGVGIAEVARLLRDARRDASSTRPLIVDGVLARELAKVLGAGGDPTAVQVGGDSRRAAAYVVVLAGTATPEQVEQLRRASRAIVPVMAVQTSPAEDSPVPYVPALRPAVEARLVADTSLRVTLLGLLAARRRPVFPLMALEQLRLAIDLTLARGRELDKERAPELAAVFGTGLGVRTLVRRVGLGESSLIAAATGYAVTRAIAEAARRWPPSRST